MRLPAFQLAVTLLGLACASGSTGRNSGPSTAPSPSPAPAGATPAPASPETHKAARAPSTSHYAYYRRDSLIVEMPGGEGQTQTVGRTTFLKVTVTPSDAGSTVEVAVDSIHPDDDAVIPRALLDSTVGAKWTARLAPNGRLTDIQGTGSSLFGDQLRGQLPLLFPTVPDGGAKPGASWSDSSSGPIRTTSAVAATEQAALSCKAANYETFGSAQALRVDCSRQSSFSGQGQQFGQDMTLSGTGRASLLYHLNNGGQIVGLEGHETNDLTITVLTVGQAVPARQEARFTLTPLN
jgi:hypothetical protein